VALGRQTVIRFSKCRYIRVLIASNLPFSPQGECQSRNQPRATRLEIPFIPDTGLSTPARDVHAPLRMREHLALSTINDSRHNEVSKAFRAHRYGISFAISAKVRGLLLALCLVPALHAGEREDFASPRFVRGDLPLVPVLAVSGGEVFLEVLVTEDGRVDAVDVLRTTPPFTEALVDAVRRWQFTRAAAPQTGSLRVFVAGIFAPPALEGPTLGEPPKDLRAPHEDVAFPVFWTRAGYPPHAMGAGAVLIETTFGDSPIPIDTRVVVSAPGFDEAALDAARSWAFRPARRDGQVVATHAYIVFGFRPPVRGF
jgi:TonB family protein